MPRILIIAHAHPAFSKGGAELAAYHLYEELTERSDWDAWFLAAHSHPGLERPGCAFNLRGDNRREILYRQDTDYFDFSANNLRFLSHDFAALLRDIKPDVVHLHHYVSIGVETIPVIRNTLPDTRIVLTLHEFLAICNRQGQMLRTDGRLCERSHPQDCHLCMPERAPADYFLREQYVKNLFSGVDIFISPSRFLKQRYVEWGLDAARIQVLENGQPTSDPAPLREHREGPIAVFGYFGQITPYKGVHVLLEGFSRMEAPLREMCRLEINGGGHERFGDAFRDKIDRALTSASSQVIVRGPYDSSDLPRRMSGVDWVIIPSIWWENSPLVIQEAFGHRRPVICSDIGGMAEKVADGIDGLHFRVNDPDSLARVLERVVQDPSLVEKFREAIKEPPSITEMTEHCLRLYEGEF